MKCVAAELAEVNELLDSIVCDTNIYNEGNFREPFNKAKKILEWIEESPVQQALNQQGYAVRKLHSEMTNSLSIIQEWGSFKKIFENIAQECFKKYSPDIDTQYSWKTEEDRQRQKADIYGDIICIFEDGIKPAIKHGGELPVNLPCNPHNRKIYSNALRFILETRLQQFPLTEEELKLLQLKIEKAAKGFEHSSNEWCGEFKTKGESE